MSGELPTLWECNRLMLFSLIDLLSLCLPHSFSHSFCHVTDLQFSGSSVKKWVVVIQIFSSCEYGEMNVCSEVLYECVCCRPDMQWTQPGEKKMTGGTNWQSKTMSSTTGWSPTPMPPAPMPVPHMVRTHTLLLKICLLCSNRSKKRCGLTMHPNTFLAPAAFILLSSHCVINICSVMYSTRHKFVHPDSFIGFSALWLFSPL